MNLATVLMCWNIPRISEDLLYELFSNAGPIEEISFTKNGKSCFVVYEHADAVVTAKDIFKDVKLDSRPLRMFDHDEIAKIHSQQEEQIKNYNYENNQSQDFNRKSYEGPYYHQDSRTYSNFNKNTLDYRETERYSEPNRRNFSHSNATPSNQPEVESNHRDWRANSMRNMSMTSYSSNNSTRSRPDLLPTSSQSSKTHKFDANSTFQDLLSMSSNALDNLINPYNMAVSRNSQEVRDHFSIRQPPLDYREYTADFPGNFMQGQSSWGSQEKFDSVNHQDTRHKQRNKYDGNHSHHYRNHPYREHQPDREPYARGSKFGNSSSGGNYRNPHPGERFNRHREQKNHRSKKH